MEIIKPSVELEFITPDAEKLIEIAGRTCYKSEDKITEDSAEKFCKMIQNRNHMSVLEHAYATFRIITDRGVTHELVRHRIMSFSQESTRYCNYSPDKKGICFVLPSWVDNILLGKYTVIREADTGITTLGALNEPTASYVNDLIADTTKNSFEKEWLSACANAELSYLAMLEDGYTPQQARSILPNSLKTEIVATANFREWLHFLELRTSPQAHPDMQVVAKMIGNILHAKCPSIFNKEYK